MTIKSPDACSTAAPYSMKSGLPLVALDWCDRAPLEGRPRTVRIESDSKAIGRLAAETFLDIGQFASYAFLPPGKSAAWTDERLADLHGISAVATQLGVSRRTLDKNFRQIKGCSVLDFIQRRRLGEMQRLLRQTNLPVMQICARCFPNGGTYPLRLFKSIVGQTMNQYRRTISE